MADDIPESIAEAEVDFLGVKVRMHVLSDGRRVIEKADMERLMRVLIEGDEAGEGR